MGVHCCDAEAGTAGQWMPKDLLQLELGLQIKLFITGLENQLSLASNIIKMDIFQSSESKDKFYTLVCLLLALILTQ